MCMPRLYFTRTSKMLSKSSKILPREYCPDVNYELRVPGKY